jgi:hypothetical protein
MQARESSFEKYEREVESADADTLERLAEHSEPIVRWLVAKNENTPHAILERLAEDENAAVRRRVAANENASPKILRKLAEDDDENIQLFVAFNKSTPQDVKFMLMLKHPGFTTVA